MQWSDRSDIIDNPNYSFNTLARERENRGVYCRRIKDKFGRIRHKYEPRFKPRREKQSLWLGQYNTSDEARIVRDIAAFLYGNDEFGWLDFEDGRYSPAPSYPEDGRYFVIPPLTEGVEGKEKSTLVSLKAREIYREFRKKQAEHWDLWLEAILMEGTEDEGQRGDAIVVNAEGHVNDHLEARPFDWTHPSLQLNGQVCNSAVDGLMLNNHSVTSNDSFDSAHATGTSEPTPFDAKNFLPFLDRHEMLESSMEGAPVLSGGGSGRTELQESHNLSYEAGPIVVAPAPFPNSTPASGFNSNTGNQVQALLLQLVNTLQQENQELKQNFLALHREFREHMLCCPEANRPPRKRSSA